MRHLERWDEARTDLEAVLASKYLFDGTRAMALVDLADVSRRTGDYALAGSLLSEAAEDSQNSEEIWIDSMIVGGLLLEDTNDSEGACESWRKVLSTPNASESQVRIARSHLDAILQGETRRGQ
jgi:hypothetical protein